ncbi:hypothetical protein TSOC_000624 [Tetrabaena socialis]|uniref:phytol kinase n=1 Tax=Tetrabaena socialis TaxID=47790 RepID=A0A2J8AIV5_9CHLO|nr:hypothetical protein TSOC_000624 [Tetrabaena socialis]|eukprot:PNH12441.1 hypothetical protein TSOC_000624 [Tetrabaena socialis]
MRALAACQLRQRRQHALRLAVACSSSGANTDSAEAPHATTACATMHTLTTLGSAYAQPRSSRATHGVREPHALQQLRHQRRQTVVTAAQLHHGACHPEARHPMRRWSASLLLRLLPLPLPQLPLHAPLHQADQLQRPQQVRQGQGDRDAGPAGVAARPTQLASMTMSCRTAGAARTTAAALALTVAMQLITRRRAMTVTRWHSASTGAWWSTTCAPAASWGRGGAPSSAAHSAASSPPTAISSRQRSPKHMKLPAAGPLPSPTGSTAHSTLMMQRPADVSTKQPVTHAGAASSPPPFASGHSSRCTKDGQADSTPTVATAAAPSRAQSTVRCASSMTRSTSAVRGTISNSSSWAVSRGGGLDARNVEGGVASVTIPLALTDLLGPLQLVRLMRWRVQSQLRQRQQTQQQGGAPAARGVAAAGARGGGDSKGGEGPGGWRAREELGLVLTALKLLSREAWRLGESAPGGAPEVLCSEAPRFGLACSVVQLGCGDHGLAPLVPQLLECMRLADAAGGAGAAGPGVGAAEGGESAPGAADVCMVAQAVVACGAAALSVLVSLLEQATASLRCEAGTGGDAGRNLFAIGSRLVLAAVALRPLVKHLPAEVLLACAPQRVLAALAQLTRLLQQQPEWGWQEKELAGAAQQCMMQSVLLLSTDERLVEGCVPGWLWVKEASGAARAGAAQADMLDLAALAAVCGPSYAPQQGPILTITVSGTVAACFRSWRWEDHQQHRVEVVALARARAQELGLLEGRVWQVAAGVGAGRALWPPRLLRLCGNPSCGNFGGDCEEELKLLKCSRCRSVRYCGGACQKQHWPQHKEECERWAVVVAAGEEGDP